MQFILIVIVEAAKTMIILRNVMLKQDNSLLLKAVFGIRMSQLIVTK